MVFGLSIGLGQIEVVLGLALGVIMTQAVKSATEWTTKGIMDWVSSYVASKTTSREQKEGNEQAVSIEDHLRQNLEEKKQELSSYERMIRSLKIENISKSRIVEQYWKPLPAIIITFVNDYTDKSKNQKFFKKYIKQNNKAEMLTGETYVIPPDGFPDRFDDPSSVGRKEIERWIQQDILANHPTGELVICQASAVDLRRVFSHTDYDTHSFNRKTIEQALDIEQILSKNNIHRILARDKVNLSEAIENGDIAFLLSRYLSSEELEMIHENQDSIRRNLNDPSLREIAQDDFVDELADAISQYVSNPREPSRRAVDEAKLWHEELQK